MLLVQFAHHVDKYTDTGHPERGLRIRFVYVEFASLFQDQKTRNQKERTGNPPFIAYADKAQQISMDNGNYNGQNRCDNKRNTQKTFYFKGIRLEHSGQDIICENPAVYPIKIRQSQPNTMQEKCECRNDTALLQTGHI